MKLLSICIPTYNRMNQLNKTLINLFEILNKIENWQEKIEVFVSDNASTDGTKEVCKEYSSIIKYNRNLKNLGYDKNILTLYRNAGGRYVFFLSDDDRLIEEGFIKFFRFLVGNKKDFECIFCNYLTKIKENEEINAFESLSEFSSELTVYELRNQLPFIFLSSFVLKRKDVSNIEFLEETFAMQMDIALSILTKNSKVYIFMDYLVERMEPELDDESGCNIPESAWKVFLGFARVKRKYEKKHEINNQKTLEVSALVDYFSLFLLRKNKTIKEKFNVYKDVTKKFSEEYGIGFRLTLDMKLVKIFFNKFIRKCFKLFFRRGRV